MDRKVLETLIEKEVYVYFNEIKELMCDHTMIFLNKNNVAVDRDMVQGILNIAKAGLEDGMLSRMDKFKAKLDKGLEAFTETENPTLPTKPLKKAKKS